MAENNELEIILNLWYVYDDNGFVYSLRARPYIQKGTDAEKLDYLKQHAFTDYLIAKPFKLPEWCKTKFIEKDREKTMPVVHIEDLRLTAGDFLISVFEEAIKQIESEFPAQTKLSIPKEPLVVLTPLLGDDFGNIKLYPIKSE